MTPDSKNQQFPAESGFCAQCGAANARTAAFCAKCGSPLPWATPNAEPVAPQVAAPVAPPPMMPPPPPVATQVPPQAPPVVPALNGLKRLWAQLFSPELLTAYKGATPQELLRLYGPRVVGIVLLVVLVKSFAYSIVSLLAVGTLVCLVIGLKNPEAFRPVFGPKTSKATVGWSLGALMVVLGAVGSSLEPKQEGAAPIVAPASRVAPASAPPAAASAPVEKTAAQVRAEAARERAARAQAKAQQALGEKVARRKQAERDASAVAQAKTESVTKSEGASAETSVEAGAVANSALPSNVAVVDLKGVGKRQVGLVDQVEYAVLSVETAQSIGSTRADGVFYLLHVAAHNTDQVTHQTNTAIMKLLDGQGRKFFPSDEGGTALVMQGDQSAQPFSAQLQPGLTKQFTLVFDAPAGAIELRLHISKGTWSRGRAADIRVPTAGE